MAGAISSSGEEADAVATRPLTFDKPSIFGDVKSDKQFAFPYFRRRKAYALLAGMPGK
jgi:hypothetical protein